MSLDNVYVNVRNSEFYLCKALLCRTEEAPLAANLLQPHKICQSCFLISMVEIKRSLRSMFALESEKKVAAPYRNHM